MSHNEASIPSTEWLTQRLDDASTVSDSLGQEFRMVLGDEVTSKLVIIRKNANVMKDGTPRDAWQAVFAGTPEKPSIFKSCTSTSARHIPQNMPKYAQEAGKYAKAGGVCLNAYDKVACVASGVQQDYHAGSGKNTAKALADIAVRRRASSWGASAGAFIGSFLGPYGTVAGTVVGGLVGSVVGGTAVNLLFDSVFGG